MFPGGQSVRSEHYTSISHLNADEAEILSTFDCQRDDIYIFCSYVGNACSFGEFLQLYNDGKVCRNFFHKLCPLFLFY